MSPVSLIAGYEGLLILVVLMLGIDLLLTKRSVSFRSAVGWSIFWFTLAFAFAAAIYQFWPLMSPNSLLSSDEAAKAFVTGYLIEKSLSVDNLFVFALIFSQFAVPQQSVPRVLMMGIVGALVLRAIMIAFGAPIISQFHVVLYVFGLFLIWTGINMWRQHGAEPQGYTNSFAVRVVKRCIRVSEHYAGNKLFTRDNLGWIATPMLVVVAVVAMTDMMFALDSIPAIFAVTQEPYLVLAANVFALLGLRSLYFVLGGMLNKFIYLHHTLAFMLVFIGTKMMLVHTEWAISTTVSLGIIISSLGVGIVASLWRSKQLAKHAKPVNLATQNIAIEDNMK